MANCIKKTWANESAAKRKLTEIRKKRDRNPGRWKVEVRVYQCPFCSGWHATSRDVDYVPPRQHRPLRTIEDAE